MENEYEVLDSDIFEKKEGGETVEIMGLGKFIFLNVITFTLYQVWWTYKAWDYFKKKENLDIIPAARAIFSIFFLNSLFGNILRAAIDKGYSKNYIPVVLFLGYIVTAILANLPMPFGLITVFSFVFFIPPFQALNYEKENSPNNVVKQDRWSARQVVLVVLGGIFWAFILVGLSMGAKNMAE